MASTLTPFENDSKTTTTSRSGADLFVRALENEGVEYIFGVPGEENLDLLESLRTSTIRLIVTRITARVNSLRTGDAALADTEVGPLIHPREVVRVVDWIEEARRSGGTIATGGVAITDRLYQPTMVVEPGESASVSQKEIFGPVVCVYGYTEVNQAIRRANTLPFAFQASVFAQDIDVLLKASRLLSC